jgi:hypothetical protein
VKVVKEKHQEQLNDFEAWARKEDWGRFANSHYDWWMFPISRSSMGQGDTYTVLKPEIETLKQDPEFMQNYRRGVELVVKSWGWDLDKGLPLENKKPSQQWTYYDVRLGKMADSLNLFGEKELFDKLQKCVKQCTNVDKLQGWVGQHLKL